MGCSVYTCINQPQTHWASYVCHVSGQTGKSLNMLLFTTTWIHLMSHGIGLRHNFTSIWEFTSSSFACTFSPHMLLSSVKYNWVWFSIRNCPCPHPDSNPWPRPYWVSWSPSLMSWQTSGGTGNSFQSFHIYIPFLIFKGPCTHHMLSPVCMTSHAKHW